MTKSIIPMNATHNELRVELPEKARLALLLLKEDLKCNKFFDGLRNLGLDDAQNRPELSDIILTLIGLNPEEDKVNDLYYHLINHHSKQVKENDAASQAEQAMLAYAQLVAEKLKRDS